MDAKQTIAIGCDHTGYDYKSAIIDLISDHYAVIDFGVMTSESVDYPDIAHQVCKAIESGKANCGILLCGTANGVAMTANKYQSIRAGICWTKEIAELIRQHNNANVLCIPARYTAIEQAKDIVNTYLNTSFEGGRHERRINKICI